MIKLKKIVESKYFKLSLYAISVVIFAMIIFAAGIAVGFHKARYSFQWGENYERNFMGGQEHRKDGTGRMGQEGGHENFFFGGQGEMRNSNGIAGTVVSITDNLIVIKDRDNKENTLAITDKTIIKNGRSDIKITDLRADQKIVAMGKPNDQGVIDAVLIRIFEK